MEQPFHYVLRNKRVKGTALLTQLDSLKLKIRTPLNEGSCTCSSIYKLSGKVRIRPIKTIRDSVDDGDAGINIQDQLIDSGCKVLISVYPTPRKQQTSPR